MKSRQNVIWKKKLFCFDKKELGSQIKFCAIYVSVYVIYEWYLRMTFCEQQKIYLLKD